MKTIEFEQLVEAASLKVLSSWSPRFVIGLHVATAYGTDVTSYLPAEFAMRSSEACQRDIEAVRLRLLKSATEKLRIGT